MPADASQTPSISQGNKTIEGSAATNADMSLRILTDSSALLQAGVLLEAASCTKLGVAPVAA